jgi:hypothetical protein
VTETVSYERIKGTVASLLFLFAEIEGEARRILSRAEQTKRQGRTFGAGVVLRDWKNLLESQRTSRPYEAMLASRLWEQIQVPLKVRNGVCHGLVGASGERDGTPATLQWRDDDGIRTMTYDELQQMFAWLSKVPLAMSMISQAQSAKDPSKLRPLPDEDFWANEFGIMLDKPE